MSIEDKFELVNEDYGKFELINDKKSSRPDIHAFMLLDCIFESSGRGIVVAASHDVIYLESSSEEISKLSSDQILELTRCGVMYDSENDCLSMFV